LLISFTIYSIILKNNKNITKKDNLNALPNFSFTTFSGNSFAFSDLNPNKKTVIIYFSTSCVYCEKQLENIFNNLNLFKNTQILVVTCNKKQDVENFINKFNKDEKKLSILLSEYKYFYQVFGDWHTQSIFLYDTNRKLVFLSEGVLSAEDIIKKY